jgi:hypothetical protein
MSYGLLYKSPANMDIARELQRRRDEQEKNYPTEPMVLHHPSSLDGGIRYQHYLRPGTSSAVFSGVEKPAPALEGGKIKKRKETKTDKALKKSAAAFGKSAVIGSGALLGSIAGGPGGAIVGAAVGAALASQIPSGGKRVRKSKKVGKLVEPVVSPDVVEGLVGGSRESRNSIVKAFKLKHPEMSLMKCSSEVKRLGLYVAKPVYKSSGGRAERNAIVMKIKNEKGLTLMQASKYVKEHNLYKKK